MKAIWVIGLYALLSAGDICVNLTVIFPRQQVPSPTSSETVTGLGYRPCLTREDVLASEEIPSLMLPSVVLPVQILLRCIPMGQNNLCLVMTTGLHLPGQSIRLWGERCSSYPTFPTPVGVAPQEWVSSDDKCDDCPGRINAKKANQDVKAGYVERLRE